MYEPGDLVCVTKDAACTAIWATTVSFDPGINDYVRLVERIRIEAGKPLLVIGHMCSWTRPYSPFPIVVMSSGQLAYLYPNEVDHVT